MKTARPPEGRPSARNSAKFSTCNPRHLRALALLLQRPAKREEIDARAGCSNAPELVAELRRRGLDLPCERVQALDRDGRDCRPGVYHLTASDRRKVSSWIRSRRAAGLIRPELVGTLALIAGPAAVAIAALVRYLGWA